MGTYLDPQNSAFAEAADGGPPLSANSFPAARDVLEGIQNFKPSADVRQEKIDVQVDGKPVTTVIFRPAKAEGVLGTIFYTHGGGWILGR